MFKNVFDRNYRRDNDSDSNFMNKYGPKLPDVSSLISSYQTSGITSRDQIINPYEVMSQYQFNNTASGQAKYNEALNALLGVQAQQQASYDEWYNSAEQQALRESDAGRNPALSDIEPGSAAQTASPNSSPLANIPTAEEIAAQQASAQASKISSIASIFTSLIGGAASIASAASSFADLPLKAKNLNNLGIQGDILSLSKDSLNLSNITDLSTAMSGMIGDLFATAKQTHFDSGSTDSFDVDSWFNNDDNFSSLQSLYGHLPYYSAALSQSRKAMLAHQKYANQMQYDTSKSNLDFGMINSDPRYSSEQKLMVSQLMPFMERMIAANDAENQLRKVLAEYKTAYTSLLDSDSAASSVNARNSYDADYYSSLDGKLVAAFENYLREVESSGLSMRKSINDNLLTMYKGHENDIQGWRAAFLFGSNYGSSWEDVYFSHNAEQFINLIESDVTIKQAIANNAELAEKIKAVAPMIGGLSTDSSVWERSNVGWKLWKHEVNEYINALSGLNVQ